MLQKFHKMILVTVKPPYLKGGDHQFEIGLINYTIFADQFYFYIELFELSS
jgi:hypothetical protein